MPQTVEDKGVAHVFPDDATPEEMSAAIDSLASKSSAPTTSPSASSTTETPEETSLYDVLQQINKAFSPAALAGMNAGQEQMNRDLSPENDSSVTERLQSPLVPIVEHLPQDDSVSSTLLRKVGGVAEFAESPAGLATAGIATAGKVGAALVASTFAGLGLKEIPSDTERLINADTPGEKAGSAFDLGMHALQVIAPPLVAKAAIAKRTAREMVSEMLQQGHSLEDIGTAVREQRTTTKTKTTIGTPTPEQEASRMLANLGPRIEQPIIGNKTQPLKIEYGEGEKFHAGIPLPTISPETKAKLKEVGAQVLDVIKDIRAVKSATDLDRATMAWNRKRQQSFQEADALERAIMEAAPKRATQDAISVWREADGDVATLKSWETQAKGSRFKAAAKAAQALTPEEQSIGALADSEFADAGAKGQAADVLDNLRDAYVPHQWEMGNFTSGKGGRGLATSARFQKARTFNTFFEGDQAGFKPKEMAIGKLLPSYVDELNSIIANREFIADISKGQHEGLPLVSPTGRVVPATSATGNASILVKPQQENWVVDEKTGELTRPTGYKVMPDQPALRKWQWKSHTEDGAPILMNADLALHPAAYKRINAMVGQSGLRQWAKGDATSAAGKLARSTVMVADAVSSEIKKSMFGIGAPFHQVQEGTHAVGHGIAPFGHEPIDLKNNVEQIDAIESGGLMLLPEKYGGGGYEEGIGGSDALIMKGIGKLGRVGRAVQKLGDQYQRYLFHDYIPRLKYATYKAALARNLDRFNSEIGAGEMTQGDVKMLTGHQVNAAYGHLNYALLDRSPNVRHFMQLSMLAPDFLEARSRFVGQAAKSFLGSKTGNEQLKAIAKLTLYQAATAYTVTKLAGGDWDPKHPFEAVVRNRRYTMRSVPEDLMRAVPFIAREGDPRSFWTARASVPASALVQMWSGRNYRGEKSTPEDALGDALGNTIPLIIRQVPGVSDLRHLISPSSRNDPTTPLEQLAGSIGLKISRNSPMRHVYEMVEKWKDENKIEKDKGTYPISKYQQLRYALEDDADRAADEYDKLVDKSSRAKVRKGFVDSMSSPWTGTTAGDKKFRASLSEEDKELLKLADDRRKEIVRRFKELH